MSSISSQLFRALVVVFPFLAATTMQPRITGVALVVGNLLPLAGAAFFGWDYFQILWLYWAESAIIGVYNIWKMWIAGAIDESGRLTILGLLGGLFGSAFFLVHYGAFMFGHSVFLYAFSPHSSIPENEGGGTGLPLNAPLSYFLGVYIGADPRSSAMFWSLVMLAASHGLSFFINFLGRGEYRSRAATDYFVQPYLRIFLMQLTIIAGGIVTILVAGSFRSAGIVLATLFIALKIVVDLHFHYREYAAPAPGDKSTKGGAS